MPEIKERPILFSTEMVKAILREDNPKTQTRRVVKFPRPDRWLDDLKSAYQDGGGNWIFWDHEEPGLSEFTKRAYPNGEGIPCPYGKPGDLLWLRETWATIKEYDDLPPSRIPLYDRPPMLAYAQWTGAAREASWRGKWRPSIFMPHWASRLTLEVVSVRVQRLQDITVEDIQAEGVYPGMQAAMENWKAASIRNDNYQYYQDFKWLWDSINASRGYGWDKNPWVWVLEFKKVS